MHGILAKITTASYIAFLKTILKNSHKSGTGDTALIKKLKKKHVLKTWKCLFVLCLPLVTIFVTIDHNVFSNTVLSILRYFLFTEASFEPITFLLISHPFVLNCPRQVQVLFGR